MSTNKIIQGDCIEKLKELEDNSVDAIITDPPYGLSFMGKKWDYDVPSVYIWKEVWKFFRIFRTRNKSYKMKEKKQTKIIQDKQTRATIPQKFVDELKITKKDKMQWEIKNKKLKGELIKK